MVVGVEAVLRLEDKEMTNCEDPTRQEWSVSNLHIASWRRGGPGGKSRRGRSGGGAVAGQAQLCHYQRWRWACLAT